MCRCNRFKVDHLISIEKKEAINRFKVEIEIEKSACTKPILICALHN